MTPSNSSTPIVLITGGSRGLGRSAALAAARTGIDVVLTYRQQAAEAQAVLAEIESLGRRAVALPLDVGDVRSFDAFVGQLVQALQTHWQRDRLDFLVNEVVIVEVKAVASLVAIHSSQLLTYLRLSRKRLGLLLNFNSESMRGGIKRVVNQL